VFKDAHTPAKTICLTTRLINEHSPASRNLPSPAATEIFLRATAKRLEKLVHSKPSYRPHTLTVSRNSEHYDRKPSVKPETRNVLRSRTLAHIPVT
jgi:hypothetical protein